MPKKITELQEFRRLVRDGITYDNEMGWCLSGKRVYGFVYKKTGRYVVQSPYQPKPNKPNSPYQHAVYTRWIQLDRFIYWLNWGKIPEVINHINGDKADCFIDNLQELIKVDGKVVVGEKPTPMEVEYHKQEIVKLQEKYDHTEQDWYKNWKQTLIDKGEWKDKETYYKEKFLGINNPYF